ncbi:MAG: hypothetical protein BWY69_01230 [Planctomycetes bacterium ADurb.Bin401]|nr:MAG: hypothetical protein BWY69_01230 [Planctomycetes bacterium ADurb.Bin401]
MDFENQYIHVQPKETNPYTIEWEPKDHECRVVPMPEETSQFLANLQAYSPTGFPYVFISPSRLAHIRQKLRKGKWSSKCETINKYDEGILQIVQKSRYCKVFDS